MHSEHIYIHSSTREKKCDGERNVKISQNLVTAE